MKTTREFIQAFSQLFDSMTSRVMLNSVTARRSLCLTDITFKNKATENKLFLQSAIQSVPSSLEETFFYFYAQQCRKPNGCKRNMTPKRLET